MKVLYVPKNLRLASASIFLNVPLLLIQWVLITKSPFWKVPYTHFLYITFIGILIHTIFYFLILSAKKWVLIVFLMMGSLCFLINCIIAIQINYPRLGIFSLFFIFLILLQFLWIRYESAKAYYNPRLPWYQGTPKSIAFLECHLKSTEQSFNVKVSRFDEEGIFVFPKVSFSKLEEFKKGFELLFKKEEIQIFFQFHNQMISCYGKPILTIQRNLGLGIQFINLSPDQKKEVIDFIEILKGEGYV